MSWARICLTLTGLLMLSGFANIVLAVLWGNRREDMHQARDERDAALDDSGTWRACALQNADIEERHAALEAEYLLAKGELNSAMDMLAADVHALPEVLDQPGGPL